MDIYKQNSQLGHHFGFKIIKAESSFTLLSQVHISSGEKTKNRIEQKK